MGGELRPLLLPPQLARGACRVGCGSSKRATWPTNSAPRRPASSTSDRPSASSAQLVASDAQYEFVEQDQHAANYLLRRLPGAMRRTLESAPDGAYDQVFAIDSLEHNDNFEELLAALAAKLSPHGVLILSGPTENRLYRLGRAVAGFSGHYHKTTIYRIEDARRKVAAAARRALHHARGAALPDIGVELVRARLSNIAGRPTTRQAASRQIRLAGRTTRRPPALPRVPFRAPSAAPPVPLRRCPVRRS